MSRFIDNNDGTITDNETGLTWEQGGPLLPWHAAIDRCRDLRLAGHADWRLPTIKELVTIVEYDRCKPACDSVFGAQSYFYWSATTGAGDCGTAWGLDFYDGGAFTGSKTNLYYVRAVRGGLVIRPFDVSTAISPLRDEMR